MRHFPILLLLLLTVSATGCVGPCFGPYGACVDGGPYGAVHPGHPLQRIRERMFERDLMRLHRKYPILSASLGTGGMCGCEPMMSCDPCFSSCDPCMSCSGGFDTFSSSCGAPVSTFGPSCSAPMAPSCGVPMGTIPAAPTMAPMPMETSQYLTPPAAYPVQGAQFQVPSPYPTGTPGAYMPHPVAASPVMPGPALPSAAAVQQSGFNTVAF